MIRIEIPGYGPLHLEHLVLDYNGTLACDGVLLPEVRERLVTLSLSLEIHVLTADTFGTVRSQLSGVPCALAILPEKAQDRGKMKYVEALGAERVVCVGNGRNDRLMLKGAALGIAVILDEGAAFQALEAADVICRSISSALDLLANPIRLIAALRS